MAPVREDYQTYTPPPWVKQTVCELLVSLSAEHVGGLPSIVLTDSAQIRKGKTRRVAGRKYGLKECLGFYRGRWRGEPPAVVLVVDNIIVRRPWWFWWLPLSRDAAIGGVLFHEVGHHLNATVGSLAGGEEASAEEWKRRLSRIHVRRKCWYLRPVRKLLGFVLAGLRAVLREISRRNPRPPGAPPTLSVGATTLIAVMRTAARLRIRRSFKRRLGSGLAALAGRARLF